MYADLSRGHEPDRARGRHYRRVLLQQGRPVLDSDVAAGVDALLDQVRSASRTLGCSAGSSDLGFLVTPGRLVTIFSEVRSQLRVLGGTPDAWVDFRHRFAGRYPALHLATSGGPARVRVPATQPLSVGPGGTTLTLWARVEEATTVTVNGVPVPLSPGAGDGPVPFTFAIATTTVGSVEIGLDSGQAWLYLLEQFQPVGTTGAFSVAAGTYQVDGLVVHTQGAGEFPQVTFRPADGFDWSGGASTTPTLPGLTWVPVAPELAVAYLEVWERTITAVEDPGIREVALGAGDTTVRTELLGQVKLARVDAAIPGPGEVGAVLRAFGEPESSGGELTVSVPAVASSTDPCALPEADGYTGDDNRLYRIEVHTGGPLAQVRLKWSRDNASDLFAATVSGAEELVVDAATPLAAGDLVEVLSSVIDLGDDLPGLVAPGSFAPAHRAVGQLGQLVELPSQAGDDQVRFRLAEVDDAAVAVSLDGRYGDLSAAGLKLRRWHGVLDPRALAGGGTPTGGPYVLENGITVTLSGDGGYRPGQYWQYQARTGTVPAQPWRSAPHGPERRYVPLALLRLPPSSPPGTSHEGPWQLVAWLDERFDHLCDLEADDVGYDGGRVGAGSDTVQEALDELHERLPEVRAWPTIAAEGISWRNDRQLTLARFAEGLRVTFTEEMDPSTASASTFVVTMEAPLPGNPGLTMPLVIDGKLGVAGRTWTFVPSTLDEAQIGQWAEELGGGVRCRVRLAADAILDRDGLPLDGDATGQVRGDGYETFIDLRLPSGDGHRGGDFHSWFFLDGPQPMLRVESMDPAADARVGPDDQTGVVMVSFSRAVRFDSLHRKNVLVSVVAADGGGREALVKGQIQPYPFETNPRLVSRLTFAPDDTSVLKPDVRQLATDRVVRVRVLGTGESPVIDADGRALDGAGSGAPSDFEATFALTSGRQ